MTHFTEDRLYRNPEFSLREAGELVLLAHKNGREVRVDNLVGAIWKNLSGTAPEIVKRVQQEWNVSDSLVSHLISLLTRSGIISTEGQKVNDPPPTVEAPEGSDAAHIDDTCHMIAGSWHI